jgi:hypothetical protein
LIFDRLASLAVCERFLARFKKELAALCVRDGTPRGASAADADPDAASGEKRRRGRPTVADTSGRGKPTSATRSGVAPSSSHGGDRRVVGVDTAHVAVVHAQANNAHRRRRQRDQGSPRRAGLRHAAARGFDQRLHLVHPRARLWLLLQHLLHHGIKRGRVGRRQWLHRNVGVHDFVRESQNVLCLERRPAMAHFVRHHAK